VKLLVGEHAATRLPETGNWSVYDLVISSFPPTLNWFRSKGVLAELSRLAFEPRVLSHLKKNGERKIPISFVGSFYPVHSTRVEWLEYLCSRFQVKVWSPHTKYLPAALNHHGAIPPYGNNLRLFEATGVGTLLVTDWKANLHEMFEPGKEVIAYRSAEECAELVKYYLEHDEERQAIARAGQQRTLRDHTYYKRMQRLVEIIQKYL
jgi:spore maturation protein CgeB